MSDFGKAHYYPEKDAAKIRARMAQTVTEEKRASHELKVKISDQKQAKILGITYEQYKQEVRD